MKLYEYTETDENIELYMEYCNDAQYLEQLVDEAHTPVEDEAELQDYARDIL